MAVMGGIGLWALGEVYAVVVVVVVAVVVVAAVVTVVDFAVVVLAVVVLAVVDVVPAVVGLVADVGDLVVLEAGAGVFEQETEEAGHTGVPTLDLL